MDKKHRTIRRDGRIRCLVLKGERLTSSRIGAALARLDPWPEAPLGRGVPVLLLRASL